MGERIPEPIEAAGGLVYKQVGRETFFLMIYRNDVWDLPKGKMEAGESFEECAVREVAEETGSNEPTLVSFLTDTLHTYEDKWGYFEKLTKWYLMTTNANHFRPQTKEGIQKVCWIEASKALELAGYENLKDVIEMGMIQLKNTNYSKF